MEIDATFLIFSGRDGSSPLPQLNYFTFYLAYIPFYIHLSVHFHVFRRNMAIDQFKSFDLLHKNLANQFNSILLS